MAAAWNFIAKFHAAYYNIQERDDTMAEIISVRFKDVGKNYYFDPQGKQFSVKDKVIVETSRGVECGTVSIANREISLFMPFFLHKILSLSFLYVQL